MSISSMPVTLKSGGTNPSANRITWDVTPTAPLYLIRLAIIRSPSVDTNSVIGDVSGGAQLTPVQCTLYAGNDKFDLLKKRCADQGLSESIVYDDELDASDVFPSNEVLAREVTLKRVADGSDTLVEEVKGLRKTNEELLDAVKYVAELMVGERERRTSDFAKKAG